MEALRHKLFNHLKSKRPEVSGENKELLEKKIKNFNIKKFPGVQNMYHLRLNITRDKDGL